MGPLRCAQWWCVRVIDGDVTADVMSLVDLTLGISYILVLLFAVLVLRCCWLFGCVGVARVACCSAPPQTRHFVDVDCRGYIDLHANMNMCKTCKHVT